MNITKSTVLLVCSLALVFACAKPAHYDTVDDAIMQDLEKYQPATAAVLKQFQAAAPGQTIYLTPDGRGGCIFVDEQKRPITAIAGSGNPPPELR